MLGTSLFINSNGSQFLNVFLIPYNFKKDGICFAKVSSRLFRLGVENFHLDLRQEERLTSVHPWNARVGESSDEIAHDVLPTYDTLDIGASLRRFMVVFCERSDTDKVVSCT